MKRRPLGGRLGIAALGTTAAVLASTATGLTPVQADTTAQGRTATPIKHLVVIFGENVSFDHYFGTYPHATNEDGTPFRAHPGTPRVNGLPVRLARNRSTSGPPMCQAAHRSWMQWYNSAAWRRGSMPSSGLARRESSSTSGAGAVLKATGLRRLFEVIVTAEDIGNSKPHPEGYLIALEQLGVPGADALAFEDSDLGVTAAISAGMRCVAIEGTSPPDRLRAAGAEDVIPALDWSLPAVSGLFATP